ncbi:MAG: hypothetical protein ACD_33C00036G0004 [uncultured bacterium]|nr:MAG: hypothetical protein ACD_33C00036G0004 [uncultured bacterium]
MSILNPVVSKFTITAGNIQQVYVCPSDKSHAIVDLTLYKDNVIGDSLIAIALSTEANPVNLSTVDFFVDDIQLIGVVNSGELNKVIVGKDERLYVKVISGNDVNARLAGVEEANTKVAKAGRLAATSLPNTAQTKIYENLLPNISYISCSITVFNTVNNNNADVELWITTGASPSPTDKLVKVTIPAEDTTILENILITPNEKIFVQSSQANTEYFINGLVVSA